MASGRLGGRIKRDDTIAGVDDSEMPRLCETCLGPTAYLRMQRLPLTSECHVCARAMTSFRFQPGPQARYKKTVLCNVCSDHKNACQCCINDLTYNIPLKVRDRILAKHHAVSETAAPKSELSMQVYAQETARKHAAGEASGVASFIPPAAHAELQRLARRAPNYSRNKAKLCFHYMKGTCTRGAACPYRHEFPDDWESNKEFYTKDISQSIKDRFFGTNDQVANKWIAKMDEDEERAKSAATSAGSTLVVLGMVPEVGTEDLKDALGGFGEISRAEAVPSKGVAFVEFASKDDATEAMQSTKGRLAIDGHRLRLKWSTAGRGKSDGGLLGDRFILTQQRKHPAASGDFSLLMSSIALACKATAVAVKKAGIAGLYGIEGVVNVQGEDQKKLDVIANDNFVNALLSSTKVAMLISEELPEPIVVPADRAGKYIVAFDPLDGSSNIECNVSIGSIFAIYERTTDLETACDVEKDGLQDGTKLVAAGYCMYGAATVMVLCMGASVIASTLDPSLGEFIITNKNLCLPTPGKRIYSINEGNLKSMPTGVQAFVAECKEGAKPYSLRYVGSMVADVHRTLCYGGIFLYPATASSKSGKLRLLYEANPMAFLMEHAGGTASTGSGRILEVDPKGIHCRCPVIMGSPRDVDNVLAKMAAAGES